MENEIVAPWATGPEEILKHGLSLLGDDTDANRRLGMISIDNAVELMIKTFLTLPRRVTGLRIPRREQNEFSENFPKLLDGLEKYAPDKLKGIDLGVIEFYHRIRNQLYHEGIGLTVTRRNVEIYAEIANVLFKNLFGFLIIEPVDDKANLFGQFIIVWGDLENAIIKAASSLKVLKRKEALPVVEAISVLANEGVINRTDYDAIQRIRHLRNEVMHGVRDYKTYITASTINDIIRITVEIKNASDLNN